MRRQHVDSVLKIEPLLRLAHTLAGGRPPPAPQCDGLPERGLRLLPLEVAIEYRTRGRPPEVAGDEWGAVEALDLPAHGRQHLGRQLREIPVDLLGA